MIEKYAATKLEKYFGIERIRRNEYIIMLNKPAENLYTFNSLDSCKDMVNQIGVATILEMKQVKAFTKPGDKRNEIYVCPVIV